MPGDRFASPVWTGPASPSLLSFGDALILRPVLNDQSRVWLDGSTELQDEEASRISERLDQQRKNFGPQREQSVEFLANGCNRFGYNLDLIDLTLFFPKNHCFS